VRSVAVLVLGAALLLALPAQAGNRLQPVPILMHHVISSPPANAQYPELYVPRASFAAEVGWLADHGTLARLRVNGSDGLRAFAAKLEAFAR
jgi:hypothetical protein